MADLSDIIVMYAESIAELNRQLKELQSESESIKLEINGFQGEYAKEIKVINQRIDELNVQIDRTIKEAIKELPEGITEDEVKKLFEGYLNELDLDSKVEQLKTELQDYIVNSIPEVKDGIDGQDGRDGVNGKDGLDGKDGERGEKGERGLIGMTGQAGQDGIGIEDIKRDKDDLLITLTDGTEKRVALPKPKIIQQGGGGVGAYFAMSTPVITINSDTALSAQTQNILVDASSGDVNVTLPNPIDFHSGGRSYKLSITRTDKTSNVCNILAYNGELILNETTQTLLEGEVLNIISDNTNWWYGA